MFNQFMQPYQRTDFHLVGEFLYIERCTGEVLVQTERGEYRLKKGAQVIDPKMAGRITVENLGEAGEISILYGFGRYVPPADGQQVHVGSMPAMQIAQGQRMAVDVVSQPNVTVETMPPMALAENQSIKVKTLPDVTLADNQVVSIKHLPPMELAANQQLVIASMPRVQFETGQSVRVSATNPLLTKPTGGGGLSASVLTLTDEGATFAANNRRCHVVVKAKSTNTAEVVLAGGFTLSAGEKQKIEATCELTFTGAVDDKIEIYEVER
ncbi:hypothetical protein A3K86_21920 [Photobacterium jeanii]|uniref:Uncharacterized protein n=1 Tax=Photobacterium jeanii TaxID=858640 RepID=A0A178K2Q1_9GAMM|nr:hypothetical protein [Photobacterium jeanii]OAN11580.1 hypothetical protein A3K86_21920 [Photobacterium jeanii]PST91102.1 hypothetical protein C9I91_11025 [Photobacterium jeanii]